MESSEAKVTIVIPAYNAEKYIGRALDSVTNQTFEHWRTVIVDDGSTDKTRSIISNYSEKDAKITYHLISNRGSAKYPRDFAIYQASTEYVLCLDADDYLDNDYLQKAWNVKRKTNADVVLSVMHVISEETGNYLYEIPNDKFDKTKIYTGGDLIRLILNKWEIGFNGGMFRKKYLQETLSYPKKNKPIYMNSDEYDSRAILCQNPTVAFSDG